MQALDAPALSSQGSSRPRRWPVYISRIAGGVFLLLYFFIAPLCYCPRYYIELSMIGLIPLVLGPHLYRFLGLGIIASGLITSEADREAGIRERHRIQDFRHKVETGQIQLRTPSPHPPKNHDMQTP